MSDNTAVGLVGPRAKFLAVARRGWNRRTFAHSTKIVFVRRKDLTAAQRHAHDPGNTWISHPDNREKVALLMQRPGDRDDVFDDWEYVACLHDWSNQDWHASYGVIVPDHAFETMLVDHGPFLLAIQYDPAFLNPGDVANIFDADGEVLYNGGGRKYREIWKFKLPPVREPDDDDEPAAKKPKQDSCQAGGPRPSPRPSPSPSPPRPRPRDARAQRSRQRPQASMPAAAAAAGIAAPRRAVIDLTSESDEAPSGPWTCETCTVFHGEEGEFSFLVCKICGEPRDPAAARERGAAPRAIDRGAQPTLRRRSACLLSSWSVRAPLPPPSPARRRSPPLVGCVALPAATAEGAYACTPHFARLIERVAACAASREPCLLLGEPGCVRTTLVQRLAALEGKDLRVLNLSHGTDGEELFGGVRPLALAEAARRLFDDVSALFGETFDARASSSPTRRSSSATAAAAAPRGRRDAGSAPWRARRRRRRRGGLTATTPSRSSRPSALRGARDRRSDWARTGAAARVLRGGERASLRRVAVGRSPVLLRWPTCAGRRRSSSTSPRASASSRASTTASADVAYAAAPRASGSIGWRDGALTAALHRGEWLLLDELNLAPRTCSGAEPRAAGRARGAEPLGDNRELGSPRRARS
ncbi:AAA-family ATPase [Aureococcus anophagefferens]|nr:AAA-family ATPase [Aureococcus anophagefferens]